MREEEKLRNQLGRAFRMGILGEKTESWEDKNSSWEKREMSRNRRDGWNRGHGKKKKKETDQTRRGRTVHQRDFLEKRRNRGNRVGWRFFWD